MKLPVLPVWSFGALGGIGRGRGSVTGGEKGGRQCVSVGEGVGGGGKVTIKKDNKKCSVISLLLFQHTGKRRTRDEVYFVTSS